MKISLGFSPCPNDTFIFDAMVHHRIDTEGLEFDLFMGDVEELNQKAFRGELDVTKLSFHAYAYVTKEYVLLDSGSALGKNCGPILISRSEHTLEEAAELSIAIPGKYTTANFLLSIANPEAQNKTEVLFSDIKEKVLSGEFDAGLIIHENRFTYAAKGLKKIVDLGEYWENLTTCPIPLGGIAIKRNLPNEVQQKINRVLKRSVEFAFKNPDASHDFIHQHAQELNNEVTKKHINLYVNDYTIDLGTQGKKAVETMFSLAHQRNIIPTTRPDIFL